jgi:hypothetical protein
LVYYSFKKERKKQVQELLEENEGVKSKKACKNTKYHHTFSQVVSNLSPPMDEDSKVKRELALRPEPVVPRASNA